MLSKITIKARLAGIVMFVVVGTLAVVGWIIPVNHQRLVDQRHMELQNMVDAALAITTSEYARYADGEITEDEAKANALNALGAIRYREVEYVFITDMDHRIVMHPIKPDLVGKDMGDFTDPSGLYLFREIVSTVREHGAGVVNYMWPKPGAEKPSQKASYVAGFEPWGWAVGTGVYSDDLEAMLMDSIMSAGIGVIVTLIAITGIIAAIALSITKPLAGLAGTMTALAEGNTDIVVEGIDRHDEIGPMSRAVEAFRESMVERERLEKQAHADTEAQSRRQTAVDTLISQFRETSHDALANVLTNTGAMRTAADTLTEMSDQTSSRAEGAMSASEVASENVQTVASAAEELAATIAEISGKVAATNETVTHAASMTEEANTRIGSLAEAAQKIGDVVRLISDIAEQTNLLALNATIEAARAGEAGRGFAVVASEVKSLANQTARATEEISTQINSVQHSTGDAVRSIEDIAKVMVDVSEMTAAIAAAVEEQGAATSEISRNAQMAADGTSNAVENTSGVSRVAEDTARSASDVLDASREVEERTMALRQEVNSFLDGVAAA